jgi:hypothetical protein
MIAAPVEVRDRRQSRQGVELLQTARIAEADHRQQLAAPHNRIALRNQEQIDPGDRLVGRKDSGVGVGKAASGHIADVQRELGLLGEPIEHFAPRRAAEGEPQAGRCVARRLRGWSAIGLHNLVCGDRLVRGDHRVDRHRWCVTGCFRLLCSQVLACFQRNTGCRCS